MDWKCCACLCIAISVITKFCRVNKQVRNYVYGLKDSIRREENPNFYAVFC